MGYKKIKNTTQTTIGSCYGGTWRRIVTSCSLPQSQAARTGHRRDSPGQKEILKADEYAMQNITKYILMIKFFNSCPSILSFINQNWSSRQRAGFIVTSDLKILDRSLHAIRHIYCATLLCKHEKLKLSKRLNDTTFNTVDNKKLRLLEWHAFTLKNLHEILRAVMAACVIFGI